MFWVATPAAIVEGRFASALRRSHALTNGHKWELLGCSRFCCWCRCPS